MWLTVFMRSLTHAGWRGCPAQTIKLATEMFGMYVLNAQRLTGSHHSALRAYGYLSRAPFAAPSKSRTSTGTRLKPLPYPDTASVERCVGDTLHTTLLKPMLAKAWTITWIPADSSATSDVCIYEIGYDDPLLLVTLVRKGTCGVALGISAA